jgi:hypothetical protein
MSMAYPIYTTRMLGLFDTPGWAATVEIWELLAVQKQDLRLRSLAQTGYGCLVWCDVAEVAQLQLSMMSLPPRTSLREFIFLLSRLHGGLSALT